MRLILIALLIVALPSVALAGGDACMANLKSLAWEGEENFKIELEFTERSPLSLIKTGETITVILRYQPTGFFEGHMNRSSTTKQDFREAINELLRLYRINKPFPFGLMVPGGLVPVGGQSGRFQSNALKLIDGVVYSFE